MRFVAIALLVAASTTALAAPVKPNLIANS
jgi:hypothetical protein